MYRGVHSHSSFVYLQASYHSIHTTCVVAGSEGDDTVCGWAAPTHGEQLTDKLAECGGVGKRLVLVEGWWALESEF